MKNLLNIILFICLNLNIVFPNSFQSFSFALLLFSNILIAISGFTFADKKLKFYWFVLSISFLLFILISRISFVDKTELMIKYIVSPLLWVNICGYILKNFSREKIINHLFTYFIVCCSSVIILYILTSLGYKDFTSIFISSVNINQYSGLGFTLHVYGSMLFFTTALFPMLLGSKKSTLTKLILIFLLLISIILSGRTALYLSLFLALITFLIKYKKKYRIDFRTIFIILSSFFIAYFIFTTLYQRFFDVDLVKNIQETHLSKIEERGGSERSEQLTQILNAIDENPFGNGFISLDIVRDLEKTYNYEMLTISTLMRFGIIISLLIVFSLKDIIKYSLKFINSKNYFADVMFLGFFGIIISSFTNPYLESFSFQWMFFAPLVYFYNVKLS